MKKKILFLFVGLMLLLIPISFSKTGFNISKANAWEPNNGVSSSTHNNSSNNEDINDNLRIQALERLDYVDSYLKELIAKVQDKQKKARLEDLRNKVTDLESDYNKALEDLKKATSPAQKAAVTAKFGVIINSLDTIRSSAQVLVEGKGEVGGSLGNDNDLGNGNDECAGIAGFVYYGVYVIKVLQIIIPIVLILWGSIDLLKSIISGDEKKISAARKPFIQRLISAVIVFLLPWIVNFFIGFASSSANNSWQECWKKAWNDGKKPDTSSDNLDLWGTE